MTHFLKILRLNHWSKNILLFIPAFFAGSILDFNLIRNLLIGFISFSFVASAVYIINDIRDAEVDRLHPEKRKRPFAAGLIHPSVGVACFFGLATFGLLVCSLISINAFWLLLFYLTINLGYSFYLKRIPILDMLIVSLGFVIRIYYGGMIAGVSVSHWLSIMIFLLALFLVLGKRRDDLKIYENEGLVVRRSSLHYNLKYIDVSITMVCSIIVVAYIMYCLSPEISERWDSEYLFATTIFVIAGILRYLQLMIVDDQGGDPLEILVKDWFIIITLTLWLLTFSFLIY